MNRILQLSFCFTILVMIANQTVAITRNYTPCEECPNISNDPNGTPYRWEIGYDHTAAYIKDSYFETDFDPNKEYKISVRWYQYAVCGQVHGNCIGQLNPPPDPPYECPHYGLGGLEGKNRCVYVDWEIYKNGSPLLIDYEHNDTLFTGAISYLKYKFDSPGVYTFKAKHSGWNICENQNGVPFNNYCSNMPSGSDLVHTFTLFLTDNPQTQVTYYHPVLKTNAGNPSNPADRWFPIGGYFNLLANDINWSPFESQKDRNIETFSTKPYAHLFNMMNFIGQIDPRSKLNPTNQTEQNYYDGLIAGIADREKYTRMLDSLETAAANGGDYKMIPALLARMFYPNQVNLQANPIINYDANPIINYPYHMFSMSTYYDIPPTPNTFTWNKERVEVADVVGELLNHDSGDRVAGWFLGDENWGGMDAYKQEVVNPIPGFRRAIHDEVHDFVAQSIQPNDPLGTNDTRLPRFQNIRAWGNYYGGYYSNSDALIQPNDQVPVDNTGYYVTFSNLLDELGTPESTDLDNVDYIWDSSSYYFEMELHQDGVTGKRAWRSGIYYVESIMENVIEPGKAKGYGRWVATRTLPPPNPNNPQNKWTFFPDPNDSTQKPMLIEKYRFVTYSSWVMGGQGLLFFRLDHPDAPQWLETVIVPNDDDLGISSLIAKEANIMKDWLMDEPATDIPVYIEDSLGNSRVRFILRRNQWGTDNRILLLFCNFANDSSFHSTSIHFPNHTITNVSKIDTHMKGTITLLNSNHSIKFEPTDMDSVDVYSSALFLTFTP